MRNLILLLLAGPLLYLLIPSWQVQTRHPIGEYTFCIPPQYVVFSERNFPDQPGSGYDVSEPGGWVLITFPLEQILNHAPEFQKKSRLLRITQAQSISTKKSASWSLPRIH